MVTATIIGAKTTFNEIETNHSKTRIFMLHSFLQGCLDLTCELIRNYKRLDMPDRTVRISYHIFDIFEYPCRFQHRCTVWTRFGEHMTDICFVNLFQLLPICIYSNAYIQQVCVTHCICLQYPIRDADNRKIALNMSRTLPKRLSRIR